MTQIEAYSQLNELGQATFTTADAAALLNISRSNAAKVLSRLSTQKAIIHLKHALWAFPGKVDRLALPGYLSAPFPSYVSLQSALYYHAMIEQIPSTLYAVTVGRTKKFKTPLGDVSLHQVNPLFFCDFTTDTANNVRIATPEKSLIDYLYFRPSRSRLFGPLPELEFPRSFNLNRAKKIINKIPSIRRKTFVRQEFMQLVARLG
ncbi:MAG: hypothetical protein COB53_07530 [Elusimicrobia bacterium]|nr:MAG: hypothetical protein COB53_07530 [Elusimicrobiota bacterium]